LDLKRLLKEDANEVSTSNVPLHTLQMNIDESLKMLREKLRCRREEIQALLHEQELLCEGKKLCKSFNSNFYKISVTFVELEEGSRPLVSDPLPSEQEMQQFREYLDSLKDEKYNRFGRILQLRDDIKQVMASLGITGLNEYDNQLVNTVDMKPTRHNIEKLESLYEQFISQYQTMENQIGNMRKRLTLLWKYLDISENHSRKYAKYTEITQLTWDMLNEEVNRCEQIKKENIRNFIEKVRLEIEEYWDKCLKSDAERLRFPSYTGNIFNEDVLEIHEDELRDLKAFYENNEPIFTIIQERQELWNQMELLQNKESDPKRYNNRGGQLLKEEKERKMIAMKLPKMEAKLIAMVEKFEEANNRQFTMYGIRIQDIIERDYEAKRQEKLTKSGKKVPQATPLRTPARVNMTGTRTPLTIEQTIINRTTMKTTGGRLRVAPQRPHLSTTASSTTSSVMSVRTENGKRRMIAPKTAPQAKRQLLGAFASPSTGNILRPVNSNTTAGRNKTVMKNASLKVYNVGSCIKRRSKSRKSISKKRRSSVQKRQRVPPSINVESTDASPERDATSYEGFEVSFHKHYKVFLCVIVLNS
jgi:Ase1/PRC1/MAP65 family protein